MRVDYNNKLRELYLVFPDAFWKRLFADLDERVEKLSVGSGKGKYGVNTYCAFMDLIKLEASHKAFDSNGHTFRLTAEELSWLLRGSEQNGLST